MKLIDLFETRAQEQVHTNPSVATLKALARNNKYHNARFVILNDGTVIAGDSEHHTHHSMAPFMGAWEVRGYVQYMGDNDYAYRSMEVYSALNKDHPILRTWERMGIENGNPDQSHLAEAWSTKYKRSINCNNPRGFSQRAHCAARRKRKAGGKTSSKPVRESVDNQYPHWVRYTPQSLAHDWQEYKHKEDRRWTQRAQLIGAPWPLFSDQDHMEHLLNTSPIVNIDSLGRVENLTHNPDLEDVKDMVSNYQNPRDVDRIVQGLKSGDPLPLPIIVKGSRGMWILAGNTRQAVTRVLGFAPEAIMIDLGK